MQPTFSPPADEAEFKERADKVPMQAARSILKTLQERRRGLLEAIDQEISFYLKVIAYKAEQDREARHPRGGEDD